MAGVVVARYTGALAVLDKIVLHLVVFFQASKRLNKSNSFQYKLKGDLFPVELKISCNIFLFIGR